MGTVIGGGLQEVFAVIFNLVQTDYIPKTPRSGEEAEEAASRDFSEEGPPVTQQESLLSDRDSSWALTREGGKRLKPLKY